MSAETTLKAARRNKGLSIAKAARGAGVTKDILERAERGAVPRPEAAKKIADYYEFENVTDIWPVDTKAAA